jgi:DNA polymerase-1
MGVPDDRRLFLLDAYALIYRAYYAFIKNPRMTSQGFNASAVFGFTNTLYELIRKEQPSHIAVVFDPPGPTGRSEEFAEYKANREAQPEDITLSIPIIMNIVRGFRIPTLMVPGYEADDVIGTLAKRAESHGYQVFMVTPDKDYAQLVSDQIFMYKPGGAREV